MQRGHLQKHQVEPDGQWSHSSCHAVWDETWQCVGGSHIRPYCHWRGKQLNIKTLFLSFPSLSHNAFNISLLISTTSPAERSTVQFTAMEMMLNRMKEINGSYRINGYLSTDLFGGFLSDCSFMSPLDGNLNDKCVFQLYLTSPHTIFHVFCRSSYFSQNVLCLILQWQCYHADV